MRSVTVASLILGTTLFSAPALAANFFFSTGEPDGQIGTATRPDTDGKKEVETGDDFLLTEFTTLDQASFTGLLLGDNPQISELLVEVYRVFPEDSQDPPSGQVPTRENSPSDIAFQERELTTDNYSVAVLQDSFTVANTVIEGVNPLPNQTTGGEGPATGQLVQ